MTIEDLCIRVHNGVARLNADSIPATDALIVVVSNDDYRDLLVEWSAWADDHSALVSTFQAGEGSPNVFGLPVIPDLRLKPGEIRLRTDVLV